MKVLFNATGKSANKDLSLICHIAVRYARAFEDEQTAVVVSDENAVWFADLADSIELHVLPKKSGSLFAGRTIEKKVSREILSSAPDAIVTVHPLGLPNEYFLANPLIKDSLSKSESLSKKDQEKLRHLIEKPAKCIVFSEKEKKFLMHAFPTAEHKIEVLYRISEPKGQPLTFEKKQAIKEKHLEGNEFFLCGSADTATLIGVLKGFSGFKRWQRSAMKLLLTAENPDQENELNEALSSYRFKQAVSVITMQNDDYTDMVNGAYAVIFPDTYNSDFSGPVNVLHGGTVALIPSDSIYSELLHDTAFSFRYNESEDITRVFLEAFRDEKKRADIVSRSQQKIQTLQEKNFLKALRLLLSKGM